MDPTWRDLQAVIGEDETTCRALLSASRDLEGAVALHFSRGGQTEDGVRQPDEVKRQTLLAPHSIQSYLVRNAGGPLAAGRGGDSDLTMSLDDVSICYSCNIKLLLLQSN